MTHAKKFIPLAFLISASSHAITLNNPGFESGMTGWNEVDPAAISGDSFTGSKSLKITGSPARVHQVVDVEKNTEYRLTANVLGTGQIAVNTGSSFRNDRFDNSDWESASVTFNSGNATSIQVVAKYTQSSATARFDDFRLEKVGSAPVDPVDPGTPSGSCNRLDSLSIQQASDDGSFDDNFHPNLAIDGNLNSSSRWSSKGDGKAIEFDLGSTATVRRVATAWLKGDQRSAYFDVETSMDGNSWTSTLANAEASGSKGLINFDVSDSEARYVRIVGHGNSSSLWNSLIEAKIMGCGDTTPVATPTPTPTPVTPPSTPPGGGGILDPNRAPSSNFDLSAWYVSVPSDEDNSGTADSIKEGELNDGYEHPEYFYTGEDGGMVFRCPVDGYKTSSNTSFTRTELREMLRKGNTSISTQGVNGNNWVFGNAPSSDRSKAGGVNGKLRATLAVNHVTTTGSSSQVGRVIVGQIHANDDEPLRLYYRKLPGNSKGSIYFAHEPNGGSDSYYEMIGSRSSSASNPSDGIALGEVFSYEIDVNSNDLTVTIFRDGKSPVSETVDMSDSGYDEGGQYMYFKAGVYNQNNTGDDNDYVQATFYDLEQTHD